MKFSALYNQMLGRDLGGIIAPGAVIAWFVALRWFGSEEGVGNAFKDTPALMWIPLIALFYLLGIAAQGLSFDAAGKLSALKMTQWWFKYYPDCANDSDEICKHVAKYRSELGSIKDAKHIALAESLHQQHERYVVMKQAAGNGASALFIGVLILLSRSGWSIYAELPMPHSWGRPRTGILSWISHHEFSVPLIVTVGAYALLVLWRRLQPGCLQKALRCLLGLAGLGLGFLVYLASKGVGPWVSWGFIGAIGLFFFHVQMRAEQAQFEKEIALQAGPYLTPMPDKAFEPVTKETTLL